MALLTTTIGAYPKPAYVTVPDWFNTVGSTNPNTQTESWAQAVAELGDEAEAVFTRGTQEVVCDQVECGIDIPTDGEIRWEDYIHYHCRHLNGVDFERLSDQVIRAGTYATKLPTIVAKVSAREHFLPRDWRIAQSFTDKPVKITLPGPMTITDSTADEFYGDPKRLGADLADALNTEVRALADAGCRYIQIDEPLFARRPDAALDYGVENLERAVHGCPKHVVRTMHMCCGYPDRLDHPDYPKAPLESYHQLADAMEQSEFDAVSIEDAHRHNDLKLLETFVATTVILGVITIAHSPVETVEEIRTRLTQALNHIPASRLIAAPDCGLGLLGRELTLAKLRNLCAAVHSLG